METAWLSSKSQFGPFVHRKQFSGEGAGVPEGDGKVVISFELHALV